LNRSTSKPTDVRYASWALSDGFLSARRTAVGSLTLRHQYGGQAIWFGSPPTSRHRNWKEFTCRQAFPQCVRLCGKVAGDGSSAGANFGELSHATETQAVS